MKDNKKELEGIFYIFSNKAYFKENKHKYGITQNNAERKSIQCNSAPADDPFKNELCIILKNRDELNKIENDFRFKMEELDFLISKKNGGEWICVKDFNSIIDICKKLTIKYKGVILLPNKVLSYNKEKRNLVENKHYKCILSLLGFDYEKNELKCTLNDKKFKASKNKLLIDNKKVSMTSYVKKYNTRERINTKTKEFIGTKYFIFKQETVYDLWHDFKIMTDFNQN